jgi:hypothetical protein
MGRLTDHCIEDRLMDKTYLAGVVPSAILRCCCVRFTLGICNIQANKADQRESFTLQALKTVSDDARQVASYPFTACDGPQFGLLRCKKHQDKQVLYHKQVAVG